MTQLSEATGSAPYVELVSRTDNYHKMKKRWMSLYYTARMAVLLLGASVPVLTTMSAWPWVIAVTGGALTVVEGTSQVWHLHDRYVANREANRSLDKERLLYDAGAKPYDDAATKDQQLALRMYALIDAYDSRVATALSDAASGSAVGTASTG